MRTYLATSTRKMDRQWTISKLQYYICKHRGNCLNELEWWRPETERELKLRKIRKRWENWGSFWRKENWTEWKAVWMTRQERNKPEQVIEIAEEEAPVVAFFPQGFWHTHGVVLDAVADHSLWYCQPMLGLRGSVGEDLQVKFWLFMSDLE